MLSVAVFLCLLVPSLALQRSHSELVKTCQLITIPECKSMPYNMSLFPNVFKHQGQEEVKRYLQSYDVLLKTKCSDQLMFYLCAKLFPICIMKNPSPNPTKPFHFKKQIIVPPCKSVCLKVKNDCTPAIRSLNATWPRDRRHDCDLHPEYDKDVCISPIAFVNTSKALKAKLKEITNNPDGSQTLTVKVMVDIFRPKRTDPCTLKRILWRAGCRCLTPVTKRIYLIAGHVDAATNQMVVRKNGRIEPWDKGKRISASVRVALRSFKGKQTKCTPRRKRPA